MAPDETVSLRAPSNCGESLTQGSAGNHLGVHFVTRRMCQGTLILGDGKMLWNRAHQVNSAGSLSDGIPRNGRENGHCVHVGDTI